MLAVKGRDAKWRRERVSGALRISNDFSRMVCVCAVRSEAEISIEFGGSIGLTRFLEKYDISHLGKIDLQSFSGSIQLSL